MRVFFSGKNEMSFQIPKYFYFESSENLQNCEGELVYALMSFVDKIKDQYHIGTILGQSQEKNIQLNGPVSFLTHLIVQIEINF